MRLTTKALLVFTCNILCYNYTKAQDILSDYVQEGLSSNLDVRKLNTDYQSSLWALKESKKYFGPSVDFLAQHQQNYKEPIDIANAHIPEGFTSFLEQLQTSNIKDGKLFFPSRNQFADFIQISQTVFDKSLSYQVKIKDVQQRSTDSELNDFKIELEAAIKSAYLQFLFYTAQQDVIKKAAEIADKQLKNIEQLIALNKQTRDARYKAAANKDQLEAQLVQNQNGIQKAKLYFNFLLNRPLDSDIKTDPIFWFETSASYQLSTLIPADRNTYKINFLYQQAELAGLQKKLIHAQQLPVIQFKAQGGIKGINYSFDNSRLPFANIGISLKWNLFNNGTNQAKYQQAKYAEQGITLKAEQMEKQLNQQQKVALNDITTQMDTYQSVRSASLHTDKYVDAIQMKFSAGLSTVMELYDAESQQLQTNLSQVKWYYDLQTMIVNYHKYSADHIKIIK